MTGVNRTAELVARVARWRRAEHPATRRDAGPRSPSRPPDPLRGLEDAAAGPAAAALREGADAAETLAASGAHPGIVALVRAAHPTDLDAFLETLAAVLGRTEERRRSLHGAALYPGLLALSGAFLAVVLLALVRPAAGVIAGAETGTYVAPPIGPSVAAAFVSAIALLYVSLALRADAPVFPFAGAKLRQERAVILGAAAAAAGNGALLHDAFSSAAELSTSATLRDDARAIASALRTGATTLPANPLTGEVGAALFALAAAQGEGVGAVSALAEAAEAVAAADLPNQVLRAEIGSMLLASASIAVSGIGIFHTYTNALSAF